MEAISRGYNERDVVSAAVARTFEWTEDRIIRDALGFLAWLVASGRLEIRIGIPVDPAGRVRNGLYHEKIGIFTDAYSNLVAFSGSANETGSAFGENFESVDVFWSWDDPQGRTARKKANFESLWNNTTPGLSVVPFPEAARVKLQHFRPDRLADEQAVTRKPLFPRPLRRPQVAALEAWYANSRRGILSMATGAGKTYTALVAAMSSPDAVSVVVAVPSTALVDQWSKEVTKIGLAQMARLVVAAGSSTSWITQLEQQLRQGVQAGPLVIIGTLRTLSGAKFRAFSEQIQSRGNSLLIVDEVHNAGAPVNRSCLLEGYTYRLGLSATAVRPFDEEGTDRVLSYFGGVIYEYDLGAAIRDGLLCPYDYHLWFAYLSVEEMENYRKLSAKIIAARQAVTRAQADNSRARAETILETLLIQRARIIKECKSKTELLPTILGQCRLSKTLLYCADETQLDSVSNVLTRLSIPFGRYTSMLGQGERERLLSGFLRGSISVLLAIKCLDEGVDVPAVDEAIILASSRTEREFIQRRGRVLRAAEGKTNASLHDIFVLPPSADEDHARSLVDRELDRAQTMMRNARNRFSAGNRLDDALRRYGLRLSEILRSDREVSE